MKKTVLITGCSSGIGEATAKLFEMNGWKVIATSRKNTGFKLDVASQEDRKAIGEFIKTECEGRLDCLVNNAGYGLMGLIDSLSEEQIRSVMETNALGALFLTQELLPYLRKAKGKVLNISSLFGIVGYPLGTAYCMSKFALMGAMESLRYELIWDDVQVGIIIPGTHRTKFGHNMQLGQCTAAFVKFREKLQLSKKIKGPEIVAKGIYRLACKKHIPFKTFISGEEKLIKSMERFLPNWLYDRILKKITTRLTKD